MKIAIIGAGFTGLSAAHELLKNGHDVTIFEKDGEPGGLAIGYKEKEWDWTLEKHYHHVFTKDTFILTLAKEVGYTFVSKRTNTSVYVKGKNYQLDSPIAFLTFPLLSPLERIRMVAVLAALRINPFWKPLEKIKAHTFLPKIMGKKAYDMLWGSQLVNKMGTYAKDVSLVWFWSRIVARTPSLAYPKGGFLQFARHLAKIVEKNKGTIRFFTETISIEEEQGKPVITIKNKSGQIKKETYDKVIFTLSSFLFLQQAQQLPQEYKEKMLPLKGLAATNLVLRFREKFFKDNTYWLSICDTSSPIMVAVEHTNFMSPTHYNNEHIVYFGKYMPLDSQAFTNTKEETLALYDPFIKKLNPNYTNSLIGYELHKAPFAQPIVPTNYSKMIPSFDTPLQGVYLANMQQVYPWDRGTNFAVELGQKIAKHVMRTENA